MTPNTTKVVSKSRKIELNLHIIHQSVTVDFKNKSITGQIQSFKSEKVVDSINDNGTPQAALVTPFNITEDLLEKDAAAEVKAALETLEKAVQNFIDTNIDKLANI